MHNEVNGYYFDLPGGGASAVLSRTLDVPMTECLENKMSNSVLFQLRIATIDVKLPIYRSGLILWEVYHDVDGQPRSS